MSEKETDILARTIYGEARGESIPAWKLSPRSF